MHAICCVGSAADIKLQPSYELWSPWIAPSAVKEWNVYNTEYRKCPEFKSADGSGDDDKELSEEYLIELLCESDVSSRL